VWELFERGGPVMWPILGASIIAIAVFIDRLIATRRGLVLPDESFRGLMAHLDARDLGAAETLLRADGSVSGKTLLAGLRRRHAGRDAAQRAMEEVGAINLGRLERFLAVLSTVAAITPLLGLLGTVAGMVEVFGEIEMVTDPDISMLAGGIWKALITTGFGLTVAIPILIAHRFIESRLDRHARELDERCLAVVDRFDALTSGPAPTPTPSGNATTQ